ncbi:WLM domain-containing protein [Melanogaster broomeanus]|nr:WLM domain-containing protein [Melanogaster broomeanus]
MVHLCINEREPNPNPYVNFTTVLPMADATVEDAAHQLLRSLAAQVKPVMKAHGFVVNSLEEYEYNRVFAGRNWNNGETVELVLRSSSGSLLPTHWLMSTLCHELAHIKHMDHGPAFQALWRQLRQDVRALQNRGYYGDGYWSSGTRLVDSAKIAGQGIEMGDAPEYMCGGAHSRARPPSYQRRTRRTQQAGPSNLTGAQTSKKRKAGARVNSTAFKSTGKALNEDVDEEKKAHGTGFRKKARSNRAREERALAAERRIQALQGGASTSSPAMPSGVEDNSDSDSADEKEHVETDQDRRRVLLETVDQKDLDSLKTAEYDSADDGFLLPNAGPSRNSLDVQITRDEGSGRDPFPGKPGRRKASPRVEDILPAVPRKKQKTLQTQLPLVGNERDIAQTRFTAPTSAKREPGGVWDCLVCTLTNEPGHLACSACSTPRGDCEWSGSSRPAS